MLVHRRVTPSIKFASTHLYIWVEGGSVSVFPIRILTTQCPHPGIKPWLLDPELSTVKPWGHRTSILSKRLANFTYPDADVKSPHSDVVFCCWLCCWTFEVEAKAPISGKGACGWHWWTVLFIDVGDAPAPGGGASLGAIPPGGGGITPSPPPAVERGKKNSHL